MEKREAFGAFNTLDVYAADSKGFEYQEALSTMRLSGR
jgi:hypothetical protein